MTELITAQTVPNIRADDTDYLVCQVEQSLRQLQGRIVGAGDKATLARLVARPSSETVQ
jgi:hypothetical protein